MSFVLLILLYKWYYGFALSGEAIYIYYIKLWFVSVLDIKLFGVFVMLEKF
tara:strand:- start:4944 stop:5096 length:153 start_codon:yes stop_codon:yes gene_type:complete